MSACQRVIVCRCLNVTFYRQNSRLFAKLNSLLSLIFCVESHRLSEVRRERIFCVIHCELATLRRRFELSANLHRRG